MDTAVGYMGGNTINPTYQDVCTNTTGHIEVVQITYDYTKVSYNQLLQVFWDNHDPTSWDAQNGDVGSQYRSVIFYHTSEQRDIAMQSKHKLEIEQRYNKTIVTEIRQAKEFYRAEEYHQSYYAKLHK